MGIAGLAVPCDFERTGADVRARSSAGSSEAAGVLRFGATGFRRRTEGRSPRARLVDTRGGLPRGRTAAAARRPLRRYGFPMTRASLGRCGRREGCRRDRSTSGTLDRRRWRRRRLGTDGPPRAGRLGVRFRSRPRIRRGRRRRRAQSRPSWSWARSESAAASPAPPPAKSRGRAGRARRGRVSSIPRSASATGRRRLRVSSLSRSRVRAPRPETADDSWCVVSAEHGGDRARTGACSAPRQAVIHARTVAAPSR